MEIYCCKAFMLHEIVKYCLKINCDNLKMYTINSKATNKITQEL